MSSKRHKYSKKQANKNSRTAEWTPHKRSRKIQINKKQKKYHNKIMKIIKQHFPKKSFTIETAIEKNEIHFFIKNCLALKFEAADDIQGYVYNEESVPPTFEISDITIIYRLKSTK